MRVKAHAESSRSACPAEVGTHAKHMQDLRFLLPWISTFAGMTLWNPRAVPLGISVAVPLSTAISRFNSLQSKRF